MSEVVLPAIDILAYYRGHPFRHANELVASNEFRDEAEIRDMWYDVRPDQLVVDVGVQYGSYTLTALACGAYVCAVNPDPAEMAVLEAEVQANRWSTRCALVPLALSDGGPYPAALAEQLKPCPDWITDPDHFISLDALLGRLAWDGRPLYGPSGFDRLDWIKIDVEGGELLVVQGALSTLERYHPRLIIEDHSNIYSWCAEQKTAEHLREVLAGFGYSIDRWKYMGRELWLCLPAGIPPPVPAPVPAPHLDTTTSQATP